MSLSHCVHLLCMNKFAYSSFSSAGSCIFPMCALKDTQNAWSKIQSTMNIIFIVVWPILVHIIRLSYMSKMTESLEPMLENGFPPRLRYIKVKIIRAKTGYAGIPLWSSVCVIGHIKDSPSVRLQSTPPNVHFLCHPCNETWRIILSTIGEL